MRITRGKSEATTILTPGDLFLGENYHQFTDLVLKHPSLIDHFLTPGLVSRKPKQLLVQATVRYIRTTRAARAVLSELGK